MRIEKQAQAGTLESSDVYVMILPNETEIIDIQLKSSVEKQFGAQIRKVAKESLEHLGISGCILRLEDKGALDYTIRARIACAVKRSLC